MDWYKGLPEWARKAWRTFVQAFLGVFLTTLLAVLGGLAESQDFTTFDWRTLLFGGVVAGVAAGIAAAWNGYTEYRTNKAIAAERMDDLSG